MCDITRLFIDNDNFHLLCISSPVTVTDMGVISLPTPTAHDYVVCKAIRHSAVDLYIKFFPHPSPIYSPPLNCLVNSLVEQ